jgi:hypothetical protein
MTPMATTVSAMPISAQRRAALPAPTSPLERRRSAGRSAPSPIPSSATGTGAVHSNEPPAAEDATLEPVLRRLEEHLRQDLSLADIAMQAQMSAHAEQELPRADRLHTTPVAAPRATASGAVPAGGDRPLDRAHRRAGGLWSGDRLPRPLQGRGRRWPTGVSARLSRKSHSLRNTICRASQAASHRGEFGVSCGGACRW